MGRPSGGSGGAVGGGGDNAPSMRFVGIGGGIPCNINTGATACMSRSWALATQDLTEIFLEYANVFVSGGGNTVVDGLEKNSGTAMTVKASIEYPVGVFTPVNFSGVRTANIAASAKVQSDAVSVSIPKGAEFYIRTYQTNAGGILFRQGAPTNTGEGFVVSGATDLTDGGAVTQSNVSIFTPLAIIGMSSKESYLLHGDSIVQGSADQIDSFKVCGIFSRGLRDKLLPYCNLGVRGDLVSGYVASNTIRNSMRQYATRVLSNYGINDALNGRTYAQICADLLTFWAAVTQPLKYQAQIAPAQTTSTDYYATTAGQTLGAQATKRAAVNYFISSGQIPGVRPLDTSAVETGDSTGIFKVSINGRVVADAAITSGANVLTSATAAFTEKDDWGAIRVPGAGAAAGNLVAFMRYVNATTVNLVTATGSNQNAGTTVAANAAHISAAKYTIDGLHYNARANRDLLAAGFMDIAMP